MDDAEIAALLDRLIMDVKAATLSPLTAVWLENALLGYRDHGIPLEIAMLLRRPRGRGRRIDRAQANLQRQREFADLVAQCGSAAAAARHLSDTLGTGPSERTIRRIVAASSRDRPRNERADGRIAPYRHRARGEGVQSARSFTAGPSMPSFYLPRQDPDDVFPGQGFVRRVIARTVARLSEGGLNAGQVAQQRWGKSHPQLVRYIKASVAGGGTGSGEWGAELVGIDNRYTGDFIEFLNGLTVFNRLPLREVPANVAIKGQDGAATGYWVGESKPIPMSKAEFFDVDLKPLKAGALTTVSLEFIRDASVAAELLVRDALASAISKRIDQTFVGAVAGSDGEYPAGILYNVTPTGSAGTDADAVRADIKALYTPFLTAKNVGNLAFVAHPSLAKALQLMRNGLGQREFEGITANGGTLEGDPVVTGDHVNAAHLILLKPSDIYKIGDGDIDVQTSTHATIEQDTEPTGASDTPVAQSKYPVSMFQSNSVAFKVTRSMNFAKRRASAVAYVNDADYGSGNS